MGGRGDGLSATYSRTHYDRKESVYSTQSLDEAKKALG